MMNRLAKEKSPYLLQHKFNPVDWYPWGKEAFEKAKNESKPIFLSVGYSTCHWCHVMEKESFEDKELAFLMNERFVNIKVDREERPDIDKQYMLFVQATTGSGGWPMSVFLTPNLEPFFGGTYFPPTDKFGQIGFKRILLAISSQWMDDKDKILKAADSVKKSLQDATAEASKLVAINTWNVTEKAISKLQSAFDPVFGGFGRAPKFPTPVNNTLLHYCASLPLEKRSASDLMASSENEKMSENSLYNLRDAAKEMSYKTLLCMQRGGIYDHVGGGFHRYSTDKSFHVPHFEKMLYDQGQLLSVYSEAYHIFGELSFKNTAMGIISYVRRVLQSKEGGFYSAEDADSKSSVESKEKQEGAFYVWTKTEIDEILNENSDSFCSLFGIKNEGNVDPHSDPHNEFVNKNILHLKSDIVDKSGAQNMLRKLFEEREKRPKCHLDDKIVTSWNALMVNGLCSAYTAFKDDSVLHDAIKCADFCLQNLYVSGSLRHTYRDGPSEIEGFGEDYSYWVAAFLSLYQCTFDNRYLEIAETFQKIMDEKFWDIEKGGYFSTRKDQEDLFLRLKEEQDSVEPSLNSMQLLNLAKLFTVTRNMDYDTKFVDLKNYLSEKFEAYPNSLPIGCAALLYRAVDPFQIAIHGEKTKLLRLITSKRNFNPFTEFVFHSAEVQKIDICNGHMCVATSTELEKMVEEYV